MLGAVASASNSFASLFGKYFMWEPKQSRVERDFDSLLDRARQRLYHDNLQVLAFYWLRTVFASGYKRAEWKALDELLRQSQVQARFVTAEWSELVDELLTSILKTGVLSSPAHRSPAQSSQPARASLDPDTLVPYLGRLLNEWLPVEMARLLVSEAEHDIPEETGVPGLAIARALERLLVRERLSPTTLEAILQPGLLSPGLVYPGDVEILRDVVLFLLGRTRAPAPVSLPATLLYVAPGTQLPVDYREAVHRAFIADGRRGEELHVPLDPAQAIKILRGDAMRFGSVVVTMDGRWWQAERLQGGEQDRIVYRPMGRLQINYSEDHARLRIPWPELRPEWPGAVSFGNTFELFGRKWRVAQWEQTAQQTALDLEFAGVLPIETIVPAAEARLRRSRPAFVDMAWTAMENALAAAFAGHSREPIEQLRHSELIPLGRAMFSLTETALNRRLRKREMLETRLRAVRYLEAELASPYGAVPWRILPAQVRKILLSSSLYPALAELLHQVFEGLPETHAEAAGPSNSPSHAA